jgi:hypothetical protein
MRSLAAIAIVVGAAGCGGARREQATREAEDFACKDRLVSYVVSHHMGGDELGVQMDCSEAGPRIKRWRTDKAGNREDDARGLTPGEFDRVWNEIDGTGWPNLKDCANGSSGKQDPIYVFDVRDDQSKASFQCQSTSMPYPYNGIVDPLDVAAQAGRGQLGDPEPAQMKALEKKAK